MARTTFINRFYHPDEPATAQLLGDLAERLAAAGHDVRVITGRPPGSARRQQLRGVLIERVGPQTRATRSLFRRSLAFACFWAACAWRLIRSTRRGETLVPLTDPPLLGVIVTAVARLRGARIVHWIQDIYPEVAQQISGRPWISALLATFTPLRNWAWRQGAACVTLGSDMRQLVLRAGVDPARISTVPNWPPVGIRPADGLPIRRERSLEGSFVVAYSGNLGRVHHLEALVPVAAGLKDRADIVFAFTGDGARKPALEAALRRQGAQARFFPPEPRDRLAEGLAMGDLHCVTLGPGLESVVYPSKLVGVLAAGKPVLFLGSPDCEIARTLRETGMGFAFAPGETAEITACIRRLADHPEEVLALGRRALEWSRRHATLDQAVSTWCRLLEIPTPGLLADADPESLNDPHVRT